MAAMASQSLHSKISELWSTTSQTAYYLAYHYGLTEQSVRSMVVGINGPKKEHASLSAYHRAIGMKLIDKRLESGLDKVGYANSVGMSHFRLNKLEKGYYEITISELIKTELLDYIGKLDVSLLEQI